MLNNMALSLQIFTLFLALTVSATASAEILTLHDSNNNNAASIAVSVSNQELHEVANSVILAETWLRNYVFLFYPASNITHIMVGHNLLCSHKTHEKFHHNLILPALKNIHHSLTRWGLHSEIKVSPSISSHCLTHHFTHSLVKPLLHFLHSTNSTYIINPHHEINPKFETLVKSHMNFIKKIGVSTFGDIKLVQNIEIETMKNPSTMRKLSYVLPTPSPSDQHPIAEGPLPPLIGVGVGLGPTISPPSPYHAPPQMGLNPAYPPHLHHNHHHLPPCNPWGQPGAPVVTAPPPQHAAPSPVPSGEKLWCVAKPSVPAETLQEAIDYACAEGAQCEEIQPAGSCYNPDTVVAHASFAFNSYWQKNKNNGGTCSFGGTAMIINSDPSFLQCRFTVT